LFSSVSTRELWDSTLKIRPRLLLPHFSIFIIHLSAFLSRYITLVTERALLTTLQTNKSAVNNFINKEPDDSIGRSMILTNKMHHETLLGNYSCNRNMLASSLLLWFFSKQAGASLNCSVGVMMSNLRSKLIFCYKDTGL
jgi:hypothetical protein